MPEKLLTIHAGFIFLGFLSFVICDDTLFRDVDLGGLLSDISTLKEKCLDYPDLPLCQDLKRFLEESDNQEDQDNKSTDSVTNLEENKDEVIIEIPFFSSKKAIEKRFNVFRRRNPNGQGYKRGPGFRSWGGKRDPNFLIQEEKSNSAFRDGTKNCFISDDESNPEEERMAILKNLKEKRGKFSSWGGKRELQYPFWNDQVEKCPLWISKTSLHKPYKKQSLKRPQFQSWGGKRLTLDPHPLNHYRYPTTVFDLRNLLTREENHNKFAAARDKRNTDTEKRDRIGLKTRPIFQSWGGKRFEREAEDLGLFTKPENRNKREIPVQGFNSWGGIRNGKFTR